jgi:hypothetical protein
MIATSYFPSFSAGGGLQPLPRATEREREGIIAALDTGELVPVIDSQPLDGTSIVAAVAPEYVDRFCAESDDGVRAELDNRLAELRDELDTLRVIIGEVMAEKKPGDFRYRLLDCLDDAVNLLTRAQSATEDL